MSIVFLNQVYLPIEEAKISPMDRGFLFGDSIYEVLPSYNGQIVGFEPHIVRLNIMNRRIMTKRLRKNTLKDLKTQISPSISIL